MRPGSVLVNHGTGLPAFALEMTRLAKEYGVEVLDAPVSGGHAGAVAKTLVTLVGGEPAIIDRCRPVFDSFSSKVAVMGGAGTGQTAKLINNALLTSRTVPCSAPTRCPNWRLASTDTRPRPVHLTSSCRPPGPGAAKLRGRAADPHSQGVTSSP
jgi:hypothetical protein